jgi:TRAP-type mannitol/chloroaromatic compound transport system substrate-binding protein
LSQDSEDGMTTERRRFIATASGVVAVAAVAIVDAPRDRAAEGPVAHDHDIGPSLDILQGAVHRLAQTVEEMSGARFRIEVHNHFF